MMKTLFKFILITLVFSLVIAEDLKFQSARFSCSFNCPKNKKLVAKQNYQSSPNGCGSYGITFDFGLLNAREFNTCCNNHDLCYANCATTKRTCDSNFNSCLTNTCSDLIRKNRWNFVIRTACSVVVKGMTETVEKIGCPAFINSKNKACQCQ
ncbi:unnamed protein product [Brachionus calyciflorus]|uniref:Uncharacterized protein n=1 Tax=Brachionus calyciflorus TaxID=104777 RepID=A0A813MNH0_9BILA|nr:unnamed protein product [Brachionus calyciflorus]